MLIGRFFAVSLLCSMCFLSELLKSSAWHANWILSSVGGFCCCMCLLGELFRSRTFFGVSFAVSLSMLFVWSDVCTFLKFVAALMFLVFVLCMI